ncbi:4,5-DOPA dioxygenase extradiol-like protein [Beauveria bassiana D1-5]|uniref:4,5-DOPA dioxygenase extradiol-like protein n=1 Tax=Beauveria bassiana D1-5 TaxID=1245745 RepID=A0A0A2VXZ8_BEABA|nr:4,5-DOPA dioxygenase extradiol-like protein [Beauveria bassiana D1-5]
MPVGPVIALSHGGGTEPPNSEHPRALPPPPPFLPFPLLRRTLLINFAPTGPMPLLNDPGHKTIIASLRNRVPEILRLSSPDHRPSAIILVTAHWTTRHPSISSGPSPSLLYDYYGFPPETYNLSARVFEAMAAEGLSPTLDTTRGWDHGVFVPLTLAVPDADIPIVQVSVLQSEDPEQHLRMGRALAALRDDNVAIVGSGFASFHNIPVMQSLRGFGSMSADPKWLAFKERTDEWNAAT